MADLIDRLRYLAKDMDCPYKMVDCSKCDYLELCNDPNQSMLMKMTFAPAADELERLQADRDRLQAELNKGVEDLRYYLETNEENGVVYIPKFVVETIVNKRSAGESNG